MKHSSFIYASGLITSIAFSSFGADSSSPKASILPGSLKGIKQLYTARAIGISWAEYHSSKDPTEEYRRDVVVGTLYAPLRKISLKAPLDAMVERRRNIDQNKYITGFSVGYFLAYGTDKTVWLITVEGQHDFMAITRLKIAVDEPQIPKLYWADYGEPRFKCESRTLYELFLKFGATKRLEAGKDK
jgi:hypothetical protein